MCFISLMNQCMVYALLISLKHGVTYMLYIIGPIMACRRFSANPIPKPMRTYCQLDQWEETSDEIKIIVQENAFEYVVCKMAATFFWTEYVN